ncbi:(Fe-S)-binding protein [Pseudomonas sp. NZIPFR-PS2]|nr:(Fe-S)-binding protein [Pseudomonas sp. NZIPFR-PS2]
MSNQIPVHDVTPPAKHTNGSDSKTVNLYASREKIYTRAFTGLFRNLRMLGGAGLFLLYFGTVWLNWGGHQAVWWNLPERKFFIFGATFWPQDFILLSGRIKLDKAPMGANKFLRKFSKHTLWLLIGFVTGMTFVGYFSPIRELVFDFFTGQADGWSYFWVGFFTLATYGNAGWLREQVCIYMCPYARFQSVMFDKDTLIVSYDPRRGELRGPRKKGVDYKAQGLGDCIDCTMCVQVCPTGIDIRDGLQIECIGCAACIDACDNIMDKMEYPRGLISYTTEHNLSGQKTHKLRPRLIGYALVLLAMISLLVAAFFMRSLVGFDVSKDRVLYRENAEGRIENVYSLKIMNKDQRDHTYVLDAAGLPDLKLQGRREIKVAAGDIVSMPVELSSAPEQLPSSTNEVKFILTDADDASVHIEAKSRFIGPQVR